MVSRCTNQNDTAYDNYGGRGITVCQEWLEEPGFRRFVKDMGECPEGWSVGRIDNDGPYAPWNCEWQDWTTQSRNKRDNLWVEAFGETRVLEDWLSDSRCVVKRGALKKRLDAGWEPEVAITTPPRDLTAPRMENARVFIEAFGETKTRNQWLKDERCVVSEGALTKRIRNGWDPEEALTSQPYSRPYIFQNKEQPN